MAQSFDQIIKSIEQLPPAEQERIRQWLDEKGASNGEESSEAHANRSEKSLQWLHENREKYSGQWVALDGDLLIASGSTAKEVYSKAKAKGVQVPFVEFVTGARVRAIYWRMDFLSETLTFDKILYYSAFKPGITLTAILHHGQESIECEANWTRVPATVSSSELMASCSVI